MIVARYVSIWLAACAVPALGLAVASAQALPQTTAHWRVGDAPPAIEGVRLGDSAPTVVSVLGAPAPGPPGLTVPPGALQALRYRHGALIIGVSKSAGVVRIMLRKPEGGALAGIRVGDRLGALIKAWGQPTAGYGSVGRYPMGAWTVSVRADMGTNLVLSIMLARAAPLPAVAPPAPAPIATAR